MKDNLEKGISIIIPIFNEEKSILELYKNLKETLDAINKEYELIFIDDGSTDSSFALLEKLHKSDTKIKVIQFRNNFGKSAAIIAGFKEAKGLIIFTMDGDLQDDPKEIPYFLEEINKGYDLVSGWKVHRQDPLSKILPSRVFNFVTSFMTGVKLHDFNCGFKCYKREVIKEIKIYGELYRFIPVFAFWLGFKIGEIKVRHHHRKFGKSKYGIERIGRGFFDFLTVLFLTKYARRPLHFFGTSGMLSVFAGFSICTYLTFLWFTGYGPIGNRPLLLLGVFLILFGIQFISIGLIGELVINSLHKDEDMFVIKERLS